MSKAENFMCFGAALRWLTETGGKVKRKGWKNMYLRIFDPYSDSRYSVTEKEFIDGTLQRAIYQKTKDNNFVPYTPSNDDLLSNDWTIV